MADNGNRGPNDSFRRSGRRRREPPIIDAAATEIPLEQSPPEDADQRVSDPEPAGQSKASDAVIPMGSEPSIVTGAPRGVTEGEATPVASAAADEHDRVATHAPDEPVLFGSALRESGRLADAQGHVPSPHGDVLSDNPVIEPAVASDTVDERLDSPASASMPPAGSGAEPPPAHKAQATSPPPASAPNGLTGILGIAAVILLGIIGWLVYANGQHGADVAATVADLKTRVATLEARPDPAAMQTQIAALDKRVSAAETDRTALGKQVATLVARIDGAGQPAAASAAPGPAASASTAPAPAASGTKPAEAAPSPPSAAPALATMAAVTALAATVQGIDGRVGTLATEQAGTAKALAALPKPVPPDFGPVDAKLAALGSEVNAAVATMNGSDARLNGFDTKINGIATTVNGFGTTMNDMTARMNGLEGRVDDEVAQTAKVKSEVLNLQTADLGPLRASDEALAARVAKIEGQLAAPKDGARVTEARAVGSADLTKATPIALVGQEIERAIRAGKPYGPEIDALKSLGADPTLVAKLGPVSAGGAPSVDALTSQWNAVRGAVLATATPIAPAAGGALNRFLASAASIVEVKKVGAVAGEDPNALVSQVDAALAQGDVPGALAAWDKLSAAGKAASQGWADAARSRIEAVGAAGDLVRGAIATLGRSPS